MRILSNWVFGVKGIDKYLLTKEEYGRYHDVYLVRQIKGRNPNARGVEPSLGDSVLPIYKGVHFEVLKLFSNAQLPTKPEKIFKGIRGTVLKIQGKKVLVKDAKTGNVRTIIYDARNIHFPTIRVGMKIEVNGEWMPFSIDILADTIMELDSFDK